MLYMTEHFKNYGVKLREVLGLKVGRWGVDDCFHNGGWFDRTGTKFGWGDLSWSEVVGFPERLPEGEMLFLLPEGASHWDLIRTDRDPLHPGVDWLLAETLVLVTKRGVFKVDRMMEDGSRVVTWSLDMTRGDDGGARRTKEDVDITFVSRKKLLELVMDNHLEG